MAGNDKRIDTENIIILLLITIKKYLFVLVVKHGFKHGSLKNYDA